MERWVRLYQKFQEWEWYTKSEMVHLFIHLLLTANVSDKRWQGEIVKRGQLVTSRQKLSSETGISGQTIRTCLDRLERSGEIVRVSTNAKTIITITNYDKYQVDSVDDRKPRQLSIFETESGYKGPTKEEDDHFKRILGYFNKCVEDMGSSMKFVKILTPRRVELLRRIVIDFNDTMIAEGIRKAMMSRYLNGKTDERKKPADFDWIFTYDNFVKVYEGSL